MKITAIKQQVKKTNRYSIFVDDKYAFSLSEAALLEQKLVSGQELDNARLKELQKTSGFDKAYGNALRYVVMRPRSAWELSAYLTRKGVEEPVAQTIMQRLERQGFVDDKAFATSWVANRRLLKSTSKKRLQLELKQKRVPEPIVDEVLQNDTVSERDSLKELVSKKRARYPDQTKLMRYLAAQGFSYDDIKAVLQKGSERY